MTGSKQQSARLHDQLSLTSHENDTDAQRIVNIFTEMMVFNYFKCHDQLRNGIHSVDFLSMIKIVHHIAQ